MTRVIALVSQRLGMLSARTGDYRRSSVGPAFSQRRDTPLVDRSVLEFRVVQANETSVDVGRNPMQTDSDQPDQRDPGRAGTACRPLGRPLAGAVGRPLALRGLARPRGRRPHHDAVQDQAAGVHDGRGRSRVLVQPVRRPRRSFDRAQEEPGRTGRSAPTQHRQPLAAAGGGAAGALSHDVIHGLDVTEALGLPASPTDRIALALASAGPRQLKYFGVDLKGRRLTATDADALGRRGTGCRADDRQGDPPRRHRAAPPRRSLPYGLVLMRFG